MHEIVCFNTLIAEDEPLLLRALERHIISLDMGFVPAFKAQNGREALSILRSEDVHLVISDIIMPVMTGLELLEYVNSRLPNVPFVILSGHADFAFAQDALRNGALDYVLKPITEEKIEAVLQKAKLRLGARYRLMEDESLGGQSAVKAMEYARTYLKEHYSEQIDFASLAKSLGFSSAYLTKLFNKYEKCAPVKYLTELRIAEAKALLYNTDLSIKEVGALVGYENQFYFSRVFRKTMSCTPSEYRART